MAVKPVQRVYELWCLERIIDVLTAAFDGYTAASPGWLPVSKKRKFGLVTFHYDRSVRELSEYVGPTFCRSNVEVGNPDYVVSDGDDEI